MIISKSWFRVDLIEDIGRKTSKQSLMQLQKEQPAAPAQKPKLRAAFGVTNKPKMLGLVKKAGKLQRLNCLEAERVLFVLDQFKSRLLLLTGLHGSLVSDVVHFPQEIVNLKKMTTDTGEKTILVSHTTTVFGKYLNF